MTCRAPRCAPPLSMPRHFDVARHPLDPLTPEEIARVAAAVRTCADFGLDIRFVSIGLAEPAKADLAAWHSGIAVSRLAFVSLYDVAQRCAYEVTVDLPEGRVATVLARPGLQPGIVLEEFALCQAAVKADPAWRAAIALRGVTDFEKALIDPWSVGAYGDERYPDKRMALALTCIRGDHNDVGYGRPVEGVVAYVDLETMTVVEVVDTGVVPLPPLTGFYTPATVGPLRTDIKPLEIVQPEGASFTVDGHQVLWQNWSFRVGFTPREGLVLHEIAYKDQGRVRPIIYRASMSEMLVPYGDPTPGHAKKNVFDSGEYGLGRMTNSLTLGCDCVGTIHYFDAHLATMSGAPMTIRNAVCLHEEDTGTLWKHYDWRTRNTEVRRSRRLTVSFFATLGNYDYGFFWHLYQNGNIEIEIKLTGILSTGAVPAGTLPPWGSLIAPQLYAPIHQHHFIYRLDMDVDGGGNSLFEVDTVADPLGPSNPYGTAFHAVARPLRSEGEAMRDANPAIGRGWLVTNPNRLNHLGQPTAYKIMAGADIAKPFAHPDSAIMRRGGFMAHTLWATRHDPAELYASGDYINQNPNPDGLHKWVARDHALENTNLVVWYNIGVHHIPRPEEWPVMPVATAGFMLKPVGFFDRNPAMDVPPPVAVIACCAP
jgi:primary-amine oxidase